MSSLYVTDLDGTLLQNDGSLSGETKEILNTLIERGVLFTTASARSVASIQEIFCDLKLPLPVIEFNGAMISDLRTGEHLYVNSIESALTEDICSVIDKHGCSPFVSTFTGSQDWLYYSSYTNEGVRWYLNDRRIHNDKRLRFVDNIKTSLLDQVICFNVIGKLDVLADLELEMREKYKGILEIHCLQDEYSPGFYWLTAHDITATKDQAIKVLQNMMGLQKNELIVFGDNANDIRMFKVADRAVAVANAIDELKNYATEVIGSNSENSVAKYIQSDFTSS